MVSASVIDNYRDLKNLTVDKSQPLERRLKQYITDVKNPYAVQIGDILVRIEFVGKKSFADSLSAAFQM